MGCGINPVHFRSTYWLVAVYVHNKSHVSFFFLSCRNAEDPPPTKRRRETHECLICGNEYAQRVSLQRHQKQMHDCVQCPTCHEEFQGMRALTSHRRSDHPHPFQCEQCGRTFTLLRNLTRHLTTQHPAAPRQSGGGAAAAPAGPRPALPPNWRTMADPRHYTSLPES